MSTTYATKRPHKKSRAGCQTCKRKKIKCDEAQPKCGFCELRKIDCLYVQKVTKSNDAPKPSNSQGPSFDVSLDRRDSEIPMQPINIPWNFANSLFPPITTSTENLSMTDVRMMHHYSTFTGRNVALGPGANVVMQFAVPSLAFENDFLMNGMLGLASLHTQYLLPLDESARRQTTVYRAKALNGFRTALMNINKNSKNYEAVLTMALLLVILAAGDQDTKNELTVMNWLGLYRGLAYIVALKTPDGGVVDTTTVGPLFIRSQNELRAVPVVPTSLLNMLIMEPDDEEIGDLEVYCTTLDALGLLYASLTQDKLSEALYIRIISWPSFTPAAFTNLAKARRPRALVICAYYMSFIKLVSGLWWLDGLADRDIAGIGRLLGPDWNHVMDTPLHILQLTDKQEIANRLLR